MKRKKKKRTEKKRKEKKRKEKNRTECDNKYFKIFRISRLLYVLEILDYKIEYIQK